MLPSFTRVTLRVLALLGQVTWTKTVCFRGGAGGGGGECMYGTAIGASRLDKTSPQAAIVC